MPPSTTVADLRETLLAYFPKIAVQHDACDGTPGGLGDCIERLTRLPMSLFADIAGLFAQPASRVFKDVRCVRSVAPQGPA